MRQPAAGAGRLRAGVDAVAALVEAIVLGAPAGGRAGHQPGGAAGGRRAGAAGGAVGRRSGSRAAGRSDPGAGPEPRRYRPRRAGADLRPARRPAAGPRAGRGAGAGGRAGRAARRAGRPAGRPRSRAAHRRVAAPVAARRRRVVLRAARRRAARAVRAARRVRRAGRAGRGGARCAGRRRRCRTWSTARWCCARAATRSPTGCWRRCARSAGPGWPPIPARRRCAPGTPPGRSRWSRHRAARSRPGRGRGDAPLRRPSAPTSAGRTAGCARTGRWRTCCGSAWSAPSWATSGPAPTWSAWPTRRWPPRAAIRTGAGTGTAAGWPCTRCAPAARAVRGAAVAAR